MTQYVIQDCDFPLSGTVKKEEHFYDRDKDIEEIAGLLEKNNNVAVVGKLGIGKSTVVWWLYQKNLKGDILPTWKVIYTDMQGIDSKEELLLKFLFDLSDHKKNINPQMEFGELKQEFESVIKSTKIVWILDEFDKVQELSEIFDKNFRGWLRSVSQNENLDIVIVMREEPAKAFIGGFGGKTSPFYNTFVVYLIREFNEKAVIKYGMTKVGAPKKILQKIYRQTKGHPRELNLALYAWCKWKEDESIRSDYTSWKEYWKKLKSIYTPPSPGTVKQILDPTWRVINQITLFIIGCLGTAMIVDDQLNSLILRFFSNLFKGNLIFYFYFVLLILMSASVGLLFASLGLEGLINLIMIAKR